MSSIHPTRRRAERFDAAVEDSSAVAPDARMLELVELVGALRNAPRPAARPDFVSDLRAELMLAAQTELTPAATVRAPVSRPVRSRRERRIAVALGGLAIVGATTSMAVAAQSALPGNALYPLKRAMEDVDTTLASGDDQKGTQLLDHASSRLTEVRELSRGSLDASHTRSIASTLDAFSDQATEASDLLLADYADTGSEQAITQLRRFTSTSLASLGRIESDLPDSLRPAVLDAAQVLFAIDQQAADVCPGCDGLGITDIPTGLLAAGVDLDAAPDQVTPAVSAPAPGLAQQKTKTPKARPATSAPSPAAQPSGAPGLETATGGSSLLPAGPSKTPGGGSSAATGGGLGAVVGGVVSGLTGTGSAGTPGSPAPQPDLGGVVEGLVDGVTDTVIDPLIGQTPAP